MTSADAVKKSIDNGFTAKQHFAVASDIENLFNKSFKVLKHTDKAGDANIVAMHRFAAPLGVEDAVAYITVKESTEHGKRIYSIETMKIEKLESTLRDLNEVNRSGALSQRASLYEDNINKLRSAVNSKNKNFSSASGESAHDDFIDLSDIDDFDNAAAANLTDADRRRIRREAEKLAANGVEYIDEVITETTEYTPQQIIDVWNSVDAGSATPELNVKYDYYNGEQCYNGLMAFLGSAKAVSQFLLRAGIDGIQYPTGYLSGKGSHDDSFNYVVFDDKVIDIVDKIRLMATHRGEVYGFVTQGGGVFLDPDKMNVNTPIHEFAHLYLDVLRRENSPLYDRLIESAKHSTKFEELGNNPHYSRLSDNERAEETVAFLVGNRGEELYFAKKNRGWLDKFRGAVSDMYSWIKERAFGVEPPPLIRDMSMDDFSRMSLGDLVDGMTNDLLSGRELNNGKDYSSTPISGTEQVTTRSEDVERNKEVDRKAELAKRVTPEWLRETEQRANEAGKRRNDKSNARKARNKVWERRSEILLGEKLRRSDFDFAILDKDVDASFLINARFALNQGFAQNIDTWNGTSNVTFNVGTTSMPLKSIGVRDSKIVWHGKKIETIINDHNGMTKDIIKQVPDILEYPIIVLKSNNYNSRIVILGEVYDKNGAPVTAILELLPEGNNGVLLDFNVIVSAYGKDNDFAGFILKSEVLYITDDDKKAAGWFRGLGLQLPSYGTNRGPIGKITYSGSGDQVYIVGVPFSQLLQNPGVSKRVRPHFPEVRVDAPINHLDNNIINVSEKSNKKNGTYIT